MSSTAFQTLKRISDSPNFFEDLLPLREDFFWAYPNVFISDFFFKSIFCHKAGTQHKLIQGDKTARVNFLPNRVQRWVIKGLLDNHHYSHFGLKTLTRKHHYVLDFFADVATSGGDAEAFPYCLRGSWADLSMMISRQQEQCKLRDKSQQ